ncbi:sulfotransferase [uncultured Desulfosarcina sp.]|uniref:sulfotransferase n=1 Tax=uncultured Desulfosarcina sp. TaxID=218289 RepID=UPI0029C7D3DA|nr:sulfotransferase [uncultured Desulfosarcina sp.]
MCIKSQPIKKNENKKTIKRILSVKSGKKNPFIDTYELPSLSPPATTTAESIRGKGCKPAILIQGVMPRCGSNYVGKLLSYHPDICPYPNEIHEFPVLKHADDLLRMQDRFFSTYGHNKTRMGPIDFLPLFGSSMIAYLQSFSPEKKRLLLKTPYVDNLNLFFSLFPHEHLVIVLRDGRDVVRSTMKTWPGKYAFDRLCRSWDSSAKKILRFHAFHAEADRPYLLVKFEDVFHDPHRFVSDACEKFNLNERVYPYEKINQTPVIGSSSLKSEGKVTWKGVQKPKNFNPTGRWKAWPLKKKKIFGKYAGDTLRQAGYWSDFEWVK